MIVNKIGSLIAKTYSRTSTTTYTTKAEWDALFTGVIDTREYVLPDVGIYWKQTSDTVPPSALTPPPPLLATGDTYHGWSAEGNIYIPTTGTYSFCLNSDDGSELKIDSTIVAYCYNSRGAYNSYELATTTSPVTTVIPIALTEGWHTFFVKQENGGGGYSLGVGWKKPGDSVYSTIPASNYSMQISITEITEFPYSINSLQYGSTLSSVYSWYVQWYQYPTNTSTITTTGNITLNSATVVSEGVQLSLTIYDIANISRTGTSGYTAPTFTYKSKPTINVRNVNLATDILAYNTELSTDVAAGGSGNTITGSIVHSQTLNVTVPLSWFFTENNTWKFTISNLLTIVNTSVTQTNTREATFIVPPMFNVMVRYNNELVRAKNIWVRKDDTLQLVKSLTVKN